MSGESNAGAARLVFGDATCPGLIGNPKLSPLADNGGSTKTVALGPGSAARDKVPASRAGCPGIDQRGVHRPQGKACDIGAFEFATPAIRITSPRGGAHYKNGKRKHVIMTEQAKALKSDKDVLDVAAYFAAQTGLQVKH